MDKTTEALLELALALAIRQEARELVEDIVQEPMDYHDQRDGYFLPEGYVMRTHPQSRCAGDICSVHNPSDHPLKDAPRNWRSDRGLMERICPHGIGHSDPDHVDFIRRTRGDDEAYSHSIHGCDGCCYRKTENTIEGEVC